MQIDSKHIRCADFKWEKTPIVEYKGEESGATFYNVNRQNIISSVDGTDFEVRYFECAPKGFTTLEKHQHTHVVMAARGCGKVIVGEKIFDVAPYDFLIIPEWQPHQLINTADEPFGFFCTVNVRRDKYRLLSKQETEGLKSNSEIEKYIRIPENYFSIQ
jgi:mannose-6-phosphate isomerase-like protein (cupin superfamily)